MAHIEKRTGKNGVAYRITVSGGFDINGKRILHKMTYTPETGMTPRQIEKAVQRTAADFERSIEQGYVLDNRQTFAQYAAYVMEQKERTGIRVSTLDRYKELLRRINAGIGHIRLTDLRPQHLNSFYKNLAEPGVRRGLRSGAVRMNPNLPELIQTRHITRAEIAKRAGLSASTVGTALKGESVAASSAEAIAKVVAEVTGIAAGALFTVEKNVTPLASKTVLEHHRLISNILAQAEKEMLVPYNAAAKAMPPKTVRKEPNYFQPETITAILEALEEEPLKWRMITHLMIVTGCRRGEIMGLKWEKVDFVNNRIRIDCGLVSTQSRGVYEGETKTSDVRLLSLPAETIALVKQWRHEQLEMQLLNGDRWVNSGYVFTQDNGERMNPDSITGWLRDFSKRHGLPHINPHAFRHTVASVLLANGTDIVTVSKQLGHANVSTTENFYSHIIEENKAKAAECIADVLLRKKA